MYPKLSSLLIHSLLLGLIQLLSLRAGAAWDAWAHQRHPAGALVPVSVAVSIVLCCLWDRFAAVALGLPRLVSLREDFRRILPISTAFGATLFVLSSVMEIGTPFSFGRLMVVIVYQMIVAPIVLVVAYTLNDWSLSTLVRRRWIQRTLACFAGLVVCGVMLLMMECVCYLLIQQRPKGPSKVYEGDYLTSGAFYQHDADLGTSLVPDADVECRLVVDGKSVWDVRYGTDKFGRRRTIHPGGVEPSKFAVFFGCSFLFGEGANDDQTIPSQFSVMAPEFRSYNYGVPGYGTQHMLAILESGRIPNQLKEKTGRAFYLYLEDVHEARVIGEMDVVNSFGADFPFYHFDETSKIVRAGQFSSGRSATNGLYHLLAKSQTVRYLGLNFPKRSENHYRQTAAMIAKSREEFLREFPDSDFQVVVYPTSSRHKKLLPYLNELGVAVVDLGQLFNPDLPKFSFVGDGHPTPVANCTVATELLKEVDRL
jgi:hypothetical protein